MKVLALVVMASLGLTCSGAAWAEKRVALVVGNASYTSTTRLRTPVNDATDLANALERLGFEVLRGIDLDYAGMRDKVNLFSERLSGAEVGLFYYAGHGLQVSGKNYLIPVDAKLNATSVLDLIAMNLDVVLGAMELGARTKIVFLDACRNNPLAANLAKSMGTRSGAITRGLAPAEAGTGTLIAFATQPGNVAQDGEGRNSPFAGALLKTIEQPGLPISDVMISVRLAVLSETGDRQVPWEHSSLTGQFYFVPPVPPAPPSPAAVKATPPELQQPNFELDFWDSIKNEKNPRLFEAYLNRYPNGAFADIARIKLESLKTAALPPVDIGRNPSEPKAPQYLGCFRDQGSLYGTRGRDLNGFRANDPSMTSERCVAICHSLGFAFAGTQYSTQCFCANKYGRSGGAKNCNMACGGKPAEMCGGFWANSVYRTSGSK